MKDYLEIGQIVNTHGLKGYIKVVPFTDSISRFEELTKIYIQYKKELIEFKIEKVKYLKKLVTLKLIGINDINEAEKYKNSYIFIKREDAKKLDEDTYFIADLIGLNVYDEKDKLIGKLNDIYNTGSNDIYVVNSDNGKQILFPALKSVIKQIDVKNGKIIVDVNGGIYN